jgi:HD-GYP domain-containing protein (c-di-GMP phosphodiesterase class II)/anti-sigma regulatory factor (Ser/Thr protein kinase)
MPRSVQIYTWSLGLLGLAAVLIHIPQLPFSGLLPTVGLAICAAAFQHLKLSLPSGIHFSLGSTFVFLAYAHEGAASAFVVELAAAVMEARMVKRSEQRLFNLGQLPVSLAALDLTVRLLGGGTGPVTLPGAGRLVAGGLVFFAANLGLVAVVIRLSTKRRLGPISRDLLDEGYIGVLGSLGLFIPLLYAFEQGGWPILLLFCGGLLAFRHAVNLYLRQKKIHLDSLNQMLQILERKSGAPESHAWKVALLARSVANGLKLPPSEVDTIYAAAILHDVGEAELDARVVTVMNRKGIPTLADLEAYRQHPVLGEQLVSKMDGMEPVARLIRSHHEHWDGSGYPDKLANTGIPLGARILAAAEVMEGLAPDLDARLSALAELAGSVIDPSLVDVLRSALRKLNTPIAQAAAVVEGEHLAPLQGTLLGALRSSQLLEAMGAGHLLRYEHGEFRSFEGLLVQPPAVHELTRMVKETVSAQVPTRQQVASEGIAYDAYCLPTGERAATLLLFDVTQALSMEREQTRKIFRAYQDVIAVATKGRLLMMEREEAEQLKTAGTLLGQVELTGKADGMAARSLARKLGQRQGWDQAKAFHFTVAVSEAATNVFKHAGTGHLQVRADGDLVRVIVTDHGRGIPYQHLPRAILMPGYSTQKSMGKGFSVMLQYVDRIRLYTSEEGTMIVLEQGNVVQTMSETGMM